MSHAGLRNIILSFLMPGVLLATIQQRDTIRARVDLVVVPVTVRDSVGKFVYDLKQEEFAIQEDHRRQEIRTLSTDPLPLSVAVLVDIGIGKSALKRVGDSIVSLTSAFTDMDEVELYYFDQIITKASDFTNSQADLEKRLRILKLMAERRFNDPSMVILFPGRGPRWLRALLDRNIPQKSLNDPLFAAGS